MKLSKKQIIEINKKLGKEFKTDFGLLNEGNLDYALGFEEPYYLSKEILRGHPFVDSNKKTAFMVFVILTSKKKFEQILEDYYDIFRNLK